jgi:hypothetical protein
MGKKRNVLVGKPGGDHQEDIFLSGIILKWILEKYHGIVRTGFVWLVIGSGGGKGQSGEKSGCPNICTFFFTKNGFNVKCRVESLVANYAKPTSTAKHLVCSLIALT